MISFTLPCNSGDHSTVTKTHLMIIMISFINNPHEEMNSLYLTHPTLGAVGCHKGCVVYFLLYIYRLFSFFLLFIIFTHPLHTKCFCSRRRTQMSSSTAYGDIQITLKANSVPCSSFLWPWESLHPGWWEFFNRKSKPLSARWEDSSGLQKPANQGIADLVRSVCGLEKSVQTRTPAGVREVSDNSMHWMTSRLCSLLNKTLFTL